jgi:hypothetical protein
MDGATSVAGNNSGLSSLITKDVKNTIARDILARHCLRQEDNLCAKL